jgi:hypothetical protein
MKICDRKPTTNRSPDCSNSLGGMERLVTNSRAHRMEDPKLRLDLRVDAAGPDLFRATWVHEADSWAVLRNLAIWFMIPDSVGVAPDPEEWGLREYA